MQSGLPSRVCTTHHVHLFVFARGSLDQRCPIVDTPSGQPVRARDAQLPVLDPWCKKHHVGRYLSPVPKLDKPVLPVDPKTNGPLGDKFSPKPGGLDMSPAAKIRSGDSRREAEVVLNPRTRTCLPARR